MVEKDAVRAMRAEVEDGEIERHCHSEHCEAKERAMNESTATRFEQELDHLAEGLNKSRRLKRAKKVCEKIGRLRQIYARAAKRYEITTDVDDTGQKAVALLPAHRARRRPRRPSRCLLSAHEPEQMG